MGEAVSNGQVVSTMCHQCGGSGGIVEFKAYIDLAGDVRQGATRRVCETCGGGGWLAGLVPPV